MYITRLSENTYTNHAVVADKRPLIYSGSSYAIGDVGNEIGNKSRPAVRPPPIRPSRPPNGPSGPAQVYV